MHVLVLVAGTNEPSNSNMLADAFIQGMQQFGALEVDKMRLKNLRIEHFTVDFYEEKCTQEEDFCRIQESMQKADALVIASPIWNFGVPAHLKNLIDRMGSFALDKKRSRGTLKGLLFCIFTGGSPTTLWKVIMRRTTSFVPEGFKYFGGTHVGTHFEPRCMPAQGVFDLVVDNRPATLAHMRELGHRFAQIAADFRKDGSLPLKLRLQNKYYNFGRRMVAKIFG